MKIKPSKSKFSKAAGYKMLQKQEYYCTPTKNNWKIENKIC